MDYKYVVNEYDDVIFIGTAEECLAVLNNNIHAVAIRDTRYRKNAIEKMAMVLKERENAKKKGGNRMTNFGGWLGKENGKQMLSDVFADCTVNQAKAAITTYCVIFGIEVDTKEWDELMDWVWEYYNSWFDSKETMEIEFCRDLV